VTSSAAKEPSVIDALVALRQDVARLGDRVAALEAANAPALAVVSKASAAVAVLGTSEELIAIISATIAAFLGVKPHIRQISLVAGATWAQQGRVTIQASHELTVRHD
jgi:methylmalonyl-CoA carboxyltransferase 12S subunit